MQASNALLFLDLYLTLKYPFHPRESRKWTYFPILAFLLALGFPFIFIDPIGTLDDVANHVIDHLIVGLIYISSVTSIISSVLVAKRLSKKGTSKNLRWLVFKRHLIYIILYMVPCTLFVINFGGFESWFGVDPASIDKLFESISILLFLSRVSEPFVYKNLLQDINKLFSCKGNEDN